MKILLSAYACQPNCGSERGNGWSWAWYLAQMGHEIWVLTCSASQKAIEQFLSTKDSLKLHFIYINALEWLKYFPKRLALIFDNQSKIYYLSWQRQAYRAARQLDRQYQFDLVHHITLGSITGGSQLWRLEKPFIFGPVGGGQIAPPEFKQYFGDRWRTEALRSLFNRYLVSFNFNTRQTLSRADMVLVTNRETANLAARLGGQQIESFIDTGLPPDYFPPEFPLRNQVSKLRLLWVGRLLPRKGLLLILQSLTQIDPDLPLVLTIVGSGELKHCLPDWIETLGLSDRVNYRGFLPWLEVKKEYLKNDVFFFTSLRDSFGSQFLEAMACGLPIVTLNHQGARDFIPKEASIKVPVNKPNETVRELAKAVEYMYHNRDRRLEMGRRGYNFARTQCWTNLAEKMFDYYEKLTR